MRHLFLPIHRHDNTHVYCESEHTVENRHYSQPGKLRMDSSGKEQEFANETSEWRNAYQREQESTMATPTSG